MMKYLELYNEYTALLCDQVTLRRQLQTVPKGYITQKQISGRIYYYLQYTAFGKKKSEYLRETEVESVCEKLSHRESLSKKLDDNNADLDRLERAAKILDEPLSRTFFYLRQCADMDALPISKREKVLSFAKAMTSLEGLPAEEVTEENLRLWAKGEKSFVDFYLPTLQNYGIMEVPG